MVELPPPFKENVRHLRSIPHFGLVPERNILTARRSSYHHSRPKVDEVDGSCSAGIERVKVQLLSTARKGATQ